MSAPVLSVVIFTRDDADNLERCLGCFVHDPPNVAFEVVVVDNCSGDDTEAVCAAFAERLSLRVISLTEDSSFSLGNNLGLDAAKGRLTLFLNPDTLPASAVVDACVDLFGERAVSEGEGGRRPLGLVGPRLVYPDGTAQPNGWRRPSPGQLVRERLFDAPRHVPPHPTGLTDVGWLMGCFLLGPTGFLRELGGFDETFWFHGTDLEICTRVEAAGRRVVRFDGAEMVHVGHQGWTDGRRADTRSALASWVRREHGRAAGLAARAAASAVAPRRSRFVHRASLSLGEGGAEPHGAGRRAFLFARRSQGVRSGGDVLQMQESAAALAAAGWDVWMPGSPLRCRPERGDLVWLFDLQRCPDWGPLPARALAAGARFWITPVLHLLDTYHQSGRRGLDRLAARVVTDADRFDSFRWGRGDARRRARALVPRADKLLLADPAERAMLERWLGRSVDSERCVTVPVAVPAAVPAAAAARVATAGLPFDGQDFVLCVGRVEPLKNPQAVLDAALVLGLPVLFVGAPAGLRHLMATRSFEARLRQAGPARARWAGPLPYTAVRELMARARVHVLGSWTEHCGRVSLEAALEGAAVVAPDVGFGPALLGRETAGLFLFRPGAEADARDGLRSALDAAWTQGRQPDGPLAQRVAERLTWDVVGPLIKQLAPP